MKKLILLLFLVSVFLVAFLPVKDTDFGWHYRCGNQFLTTGRLCLKNEFSYFLSDYQAYNPSFIYDIILAFVYNHFGFVGVSLLGSIILTFSAFFFFQLLKGPFWFRIISFYLIFFLSYSVFGLGTRSQIVSFLFFVITLYLLNKILNHKQILNSNNENNIKSHPELVSGSLNKTKKDMTQSYYSRDKEVRDDRKNLVNLNLFRISNFEFRIYFLLSILLLIWVNAHIGFFLGPILVGIFILSQILERFTLKKINRWHEPGSPNKAAVDENFKISEKDLSLNQPSLAKKEAYEIKQALVGAGEQQNLLIFLFFLFSFFITFLNPFGPKVYLEIFRHAQAPLNTMIAEWVAPPFWQKILIIFFSVQVVILLTINKWRNGWREPGISAINLFANKTTTLLINKKTAGRNGRDPIKAQLDDNSDQLNQNLYFQAAKNEINDIENIRTSIDGREISARNRFFDIFLLFLFAFLALTGRRNLPYFYTILFYIISQFFKIKKGETPQWGVSTIYFSHFILPILISFIFFLSVTQIPQTLAFDQSWKNYCQNGLLPLPCQAIEKNNLKNLSGKLYTAYEWGGFLIWQAPKLKVFVDGRMSAWKSEKEPYPGSGQYPYQVYLYIIQAREGWDKILKKYQTNYLLIGNGTFLDLELQKNGGKYGLKEVYRDQTAVFYASVLSE